MKLNSKDEAITLIYCSTTRIMFLHSVLRLTNVTNISSFPGIDM